MWWIIKVKMWVGINQTKVKGQFGMPNFTMLQRKPWHVCGGVKYFNKRATKKVEGHGQVRTWLRAVVPCRKPTKGSLVYKSHHVQRIAQSFEPDSRRPCIQAQPNRLILHYYWDRLWSSWQNTDNTVCKNRKTGRKCQIQRNMCMGTIWRRSKRNPKKAVWTRRISQ